MERLLQVEDRFLIAGRGVVVAPVLPLSGRTSFQAFQDTVQVRRPDGTTRDLLAEFAPEHHRLIAGGSRWCIVVRFPSASKDDIPVGSIILASAETHDRIL